MKILVTGSEGNIGRKLVPYLRKLGHEVTRLDIMQEYADDYIKHDVRDEFGDIGHFDVIYHLAGMVSRITCEKARRLAATTNIMGICNIIIWCLKENVKLINFSTSEVYGNIEGLMSEDRGDIDPNNLYGFTKMVAERFIMHDVVNGLKAVTVRPFMIYDEDETRGVHRSAMIRFAEALVNKQPITVHLHSKRSWLHIEDAVEAFEKCMHLDEHEIINIGHPIIKPMAEIAFIMCELLDLNPTEYVKAKELPSKMTLVKEPDLTKQKELLGFEPKISIEEGIKRVIEKCQE
jgi:nucleoside-diphosphate-sugar epimerase